jgi:hypothetical protein
VTYGSVIAIVIGTSPLFTSEPAKAHWVDCLSGAYGGMTFNTLRAEGWFSISEKLHFEQLLMMTSVSSYGVTPPIIEFISTDGNPRDFWSPIVHHAWSNGIVSANLNSSFALWMTSVIESTPVDTCNISGILVP